MVQLVDFGPVGFGHSYILVELSFGRVVVWSSCRLVELVLVNLSVVELTDYHQEGG
jgi:hypothetical protein